VFTEDQGERQCREWSSKCNLNKPSVVIFLKRWETEEYRKMECMWTNYVGYKQLQFFKSNFGKTLCESRVMCSAELWVLDETRK
jgi:hypothetical protein